jgi:hypothetical protein
MRDDAPGTASDQETEPRPDADTSEAAEPEGGETAEAQGGETAEAQGGETAEAQGGETAEPQGGLWGKRGVRVAAGVAALLVAAGVVLGVTSALRGSVPADARIPVPPAKNNVVDSADVTLQQQLENIVHSSGQGVVAIGSARGADLGSGFVITRSGLVLASYHGLQGAGPLTARLVVSRKTYPATVVGSDPKANLVLLQLSGGTGFTPVRIGTTAGVHDGDRVASGGGAWSAKGLTVSFGGISAIGVPVSLDGQRLTGLLEVTSLGVPARELGGPVFNVSGQVLGLSVGQGSSGAGDGYVVPIDSALQVARQIAGQ